MVDPFNNNFEKLIHIVSGMEASPVVQEAALNMWEIGEAEVNSYMDNLLSKEADVYHKMQKTKLKTFGTQSETMNVKNTKNEIVAIKSTKDLFAKLVLLAKSRDIDMKEVLKYTLRPFPSPLSLYDGSMVKTQKSKLLEIIEKKSNVDCIVSIPERSCLVIDAMAMLQVLKNVPNNFENLATTIFKTAISLASLAAFESM